MDENPPREEIIAVAANAQRQHMIMAIAMIVAIGLATVFSFHASGYPACCDARQYVEMARHFETSGFNPYAPHADVRTFGYPLFISLVSRVARPFGLPLSLSLFVVQTVMYFVGVIALYRLVSRRYGQAAGAFVYYGLVFNLLLLPYLSLTLTDGFSVILLLAAAYVLIGMPADGPRGKVLFRAALLGLIVGFAVVVRPANLWFVSLILIGVLATWRRAAPTARQSATGATGAAVAFLAVALVAGAIATLPQSALNWVRARQATPLPIYDIKTKQVEAGLRNIKYATSVVGRPAGVFYANPLFSGTDAPAGIGWYFREPLRAAGTIGLRMFGAFDFDYFYPYIDDHRPSYRPALFALSQFILFFGLGGVLLLASPALARRTLGAAAAQEFRWKGSVSAGQAFGLVFLAWAVIYGPSAIENRFALPMITLLMPVAVGAAWTVVKLFRGGAVTRALCILAAFLVWVAIALPIARVLEHAKQLPLP